VKDIVKNNMSNTDNTENLDYNKNSTRKNKTQLAVTTEPPAKNKGGHPTKFNPARADVMVRALAAGLTHEQACRATGIARETLHSWTEKFPEFKKRVDAARDEARQAALEGIKDAAKEDWRAWSKWLQLAFPGDYLPAPNRGDINVTSSNVVICDEQTRQQIQDMRRKLLGRGADQNHYNGNHEPGPRTTDTDYEPEPEEQE
jgi:hypothetical protein